MVNTDRSIGKAVKVRFLEGYNSREVLDFNLYPVAERRVDGGVSQTADVADGGGAQVSTTDQSCTDPDVLREFAACRSSRPPSTARGRRSGRRRPAGHHAYA